MGILTIQAKPLTPETFAPYGKVLYIPTDNNPDRPTDRFNFWPKQSLFSCESGVFQIGVSTFFKRPFRTMNLERHYRTDELMTPLDGTFVLLFCKNEGLEKGEVPDFTKSEAFIMHSNQGMVVDKGVWHWSPMPLEDHITMLCSLAEDTQKNDLEIITLPAGNVIEVTV